MPQQCKQADYTQLPQQNLIERVDTGLLPVTGDSGLLHVAGEGVAWSECPGCDVPHIRRLQGLYLRALLQNGAPGACQRVVGRQRCSHARIPPERIHKLHLGRLCTAGALSQLLCNLR